MLERLYRISEKKNCGVTITSAGVINPVNYPVYPPELKIPNYKSLDCVCPDPCGIHKEIPFCNVQLKPSPFGSKLYDRLGCFKGVIKSYWGLDEDADKYVNEVKAIIDKPLDNLELEHIRLAMANIKCPHKLDILMFYELTRRLPHEDLNYDDERLLIHFYDTFCNESIKLLGCMVRCRTNILCHLLDKIGKKPNADHFQLMKGPCHQQTEEEIKFVFDHLGWDYSSIQLA